MVQKIFKFKFTSTCVREGDKEREGKRRHRNNLHSPRSFYKLSMYSHSRGPPYRKRYLLIAGQLLSVHLKRAIRYAPPNAINSEKRRAKHVFCAVAVFGRAFRASAVSGLFFFAVAAFVDYPFKELHCVQLFNVCMKINV